jgi:hypothetical protein
MLFTEWKLIILLVLVLLTQSAQGFGRMLVAFSMFFQEKNHSLNPKIQQ